MSDTQPKPDRVTYTMTPYYSEYCVNAVLAGKKLSTICIVKSKKAAVAYLDHLEAAYTDGKHAALIGLTLPLVRDVIPLHCDNVPAGTVVTVQKLLTRNWFQVTTGKLEFSCVYEDLRQE